jgi:hypothetical protein
VLSEGGVEAVDGVELSIVEGHASYVGDVERERREALARATNAAWGYVDPGDVVATIRQWASVAAVAAPHVGYAGWRWGELLQEESDRVVAPVAGLDCVEVQRVRNWTKEVLRSMSVDQSHVAVACGAARHGITT